MLDRPTLTIIAGINGAGKSSLRDYVPNLGAVIDPDKIQREKFSHLPLEKAQMQAGREAVRLQRYYIDNKVSFTQETTLSGKSILKSIKDIKEMGFKIVLLFVGIEGVELAKHRIALRVEKGGHYIPDKTVESRYGKTLENLPKVLELCDQAAIYDNTNQHKIVAVYTNGAIKIATNKVPFWLEQALGKWNAGTREGEVAITEENMKK